MPTALIKLKQIEPIPGGTALTVTEIATATYTVLAADQFIACDTTAVGGEIQVTLPPASAGVRELDIKNKNGGGGGRRVRVLPDGTDTIDDDNDKVVRRRDSIRLRSNGVDTWYVA